jgi:CheY-like chemotaxis protein
MANFDDHKFCKSILDLAQAYGPVDFWMDNLTSGKNPDVTWRALIVVAALKDPLYAESAKLMLKSPDSRVRAWACTALAALDYKPAFGLLQEAKQDFSFRVRYHAKRAVRKMSGISHMPPRRHIRAPQKEMLILISEDDKTIQLYINVQLSRLGFLVQIASTERDTIELAIKLRPWLIITDNQKINLERQVDNLSGLNMTWDLCRNKTLRETLIFMITADYLEPAFLWSGGDAFFQKPITPEFLYELGEYYQGA